LAIAALPLEAVHTHQLFSVLITHCISQFHIVQLTAELLIIQHIFLAHFSRRGRDDILMSSRGDLYQI